MFVSCSFGWCLAHSQEIGDRRRLGLTGSGRPFTAFTMLADTCKGYFCYFYHLGNCRQEFAFLKQWHSQKVSCYKSVKQAHMNEQLHYAPLSRHQMFKTTTVRFQPVSHWRTSLSWELIKSSTLSTVAASGVLGLCWRFSSIDTATEVFSAVDDIYFVHRTPQWLSSRNSKLSSRNIWTRNSRRPLYSHTPVYIPVSDRISITSQQLPDNL